MVMEQLELPPSPSEAPPPAYEFSQQEFDRKVTAAVERSMASEEQDRAQREQRGDGWQKWDEDEYEAAARLLAEKYGQMSVSEASSSSLSSGPAASSSSTSASTSANDDTCGNEQDVEPVRPLSIQKKSKTRRPEPTVQSTKERPSWYEDAQLGEPPSESHSSNGRVTDCLRMSTGQSLQQPLDTASLVSDSSDDDHVLPPPPFAAVDTSLDGPAYERYPLNQRRQVGQQFVLQYRGSEHGSPLPSPPRSPPVMTDQFPNPYEVHAYQRLPQQYRPPQPSRVQTRPNIPRPPSASKTVLVQPPPPPRMDFNVSMAYTKSVYSEPSPVSPVQQGGAAALYNSSVASFMPGGANCNLPPPSQGRKPTPSMISTRSDSSINYNQHRPPQPYNQPYHESQAGFGANRPLLYQQQQGYAQQYATMPVSSYPQGGQPSWARPQAAYPPQQQYYPR